MLQSNWTLSEAWFESTNHTKINTYITLQISEYSGNFGDQLTGSYSADGMYFTTIDEDHDTYSSFNCAIMMKGNW